jgi:hypothetical protein
MRFIIFSFLVLFGLSMNASISFMSSRDFAHCAPKKFFAHTELSDELPMITTRRFRIFLAKIDFCGVAHYCSFQTEDDARVLFQAVAQGAASNIDWYYYDHDQAEE